MRGLLRPAIFESLWRDVAGRIRLEHAGDSAVITDVGKRDRKRGLAARVGYVEVEVGHHAVADVAALGDDLPLLYYVAHLHTIAVFAQVKIVPQRAVVMLDGYEVVRPAATVAVVRDDDPDHFTAACGANFRADRHAEVIRKTSRAAVADDPPVALDAAVALAGGPGKAVWGLTCRRILAFGTGSHAVTDNQAGEQCEEQDNSRSPFPFQNFQDR